MFNVHVLLSEGEKWSMFNCPVGHFGFDHGQFAFWPWAISVLMLVNLRLGAGLLFSVQRYDIIRAQTNPEGRGVWISVKGKFQRNQERCQRCQDECQHFQETVNRNQEKTTQSVVILVILVICQNRKLIVKIRHYNINILFIYSELWPRFRNRFWPFWPWPFWPHRFWSTQKNNVFFTENAD